ncbi:serine/threonine protein kinase, partial [Anaerolinea thermolimosa]
MPLQPGSLLNQRYRIDEVIAQGGMGAIYAAHDLTLNLKVAIKENFLPGEEHVRQFSLEANILATLRHPNLPRVTDHFTVPGSGQYLVMDYIEGTDLRQWMKNKGALEEVEVLKIGIEICNALIYLHTRQPPILHRDIKPGNVRLTPTGRVFLVDFGLAKRSLQGEKTTTGAQALTPGYAPPEQYGQGTDPRSDIYALGATLYAALTGMIPEDGLGRAMGSVELTPILHHKPHISPATARVIEKAMAVLPGDRYPSAQAFQLELKRALEMTSQGAVISPPSQLPEQNIPAKNPPLSTSGPARKKAGLLLSLVGIIAFGLTIAGLFTRKPLPTP